MHRLPVKMLLKEPLKAIDGVLTALAQMDKNNKRSGHNKPAQPQKPENIKHPADLVHPKIKEPKLNLQPHPKDIKQKANLLLQIFPHPQLNLEPLN